MDQGHSYKSVAGPAGRKLWAVCQGATLGDLEQDGTLLLEGYGWPGRRLRRRGGGIMFVCACVLGECMCGWRVDGGDINRLQVHRSHPQRLINSCRYEVSWKLQSLTCTPEIGLSGKKEKRKEWNEAHFTKVKSSNINGEWNHTSSIVFFSQKWQKNIMPKKSGAVTHYGE